MTKLLLLTLAFPSLALASVSPPAVAVMPFKDLSGGKGAIGEAIRETVTTDLKDVSGLRVIERSNIDKILAEQNLQGSKTDLDPLSTVKIGKLLGATLIVAGAYQKAAANVRLTARFVKVETGEVVGTAKVDGAQSDFLSLQDRVTVALLKSAGIESKQQQRFVRPRPKLKSIKSVELYGDAVVEADDGKKKQLLLASLNEDANFSYASRDLDALEQRLRQFDALAGKEQERANRELRELLKQEKDPAQISIRYNQLFTNLMTQRRWRQLLVTARAVEANPPPPAPMQLPLGELAGFYLVFAESALHDDDGVMRDGEKFLAKHPASNYVMSVRSSMDQAIDHKRLLLEGGKKVEAQLAKMDAKERGDLCRVAAVYKEHGQLKEARRLYEDCLRAGTSVIAPKYIYLIVMMICAEMSDFPAARRYYGELEKADPDTARSVRGVQMGWPSD